jgi:class 3 adenylate cyclase
MDPVASVRRASLDQADEERRFSRGIGTVVDLGSVVIGRAVLEPGWRWSVDIKPSVGTASCEIHHIHLLLSGRFAVRMEGGETEEFGPNDVMDIPPGHDAWVVGDEPAVLIDIAGNSVDFGMPVARSRSVATILMTDIVSSTELAGRIGDAAWRQRLAEHDRVVRRQLERFRGREIDTTGDGFLAVFDSAEAALLAALAIRDAVRDVGLEVRVGVHSGEIELTGDDVRGVAVHATARIMAEAGPSQVVASAVTAALGEGARSEFSELGERALKGLERPIRLFQVEPA